MSESKAVILGCSGTRLTAEERTFYAGEQPWGFILFGRNIEEHVQIADLVAALRDSIGRPDAPVLIDQEGGRVQRIKPPLAQKYPAGAVIGELYRRDRGAGLRAAWLMSRLHAFDLSRYGISVDCLPVLDVPVEGGGHDVIGNRAYGHDAGSVAALGAAAAAGLKAGGLLPVMKHVPGHGRAAVDTHLQLARVDASRAELEGSDFKPFRALKDEPMAMTAHVVYAALDADRPATTSPVVIEEIIRGAIGFDGLLMSDDVSMKALSGDYSDRTRAILAAGCDVALHCNGLMDEMKAVVQATPALSGRARERADAVMAAFLPADGADEAALRAEFGELLAVA
ncbi:MAG: beta-N-acetylhexosaminidase [Pararhizobium sp.]